MLIHFILQLVSISLILHVFRTDERFAARGSHLGESRLTILVATLLELTLADQSFTYGVAAAITSGLIAALLTFTGLAARKPRIIWQNGRADASGSGKPWAAGKSARKARRHRRTRSGRVIAVPDGTPIPPSEVVTVGEVEAAGGLGLADERTSLLGGDAGREAEQGRAAGGGSVRATG